MTSGRSLPSPRTLVAALWTALAALLLGTQFAPPPQLVPVDHAPSARAFKPTPLVARGQAAEALVRMASTAAAKADNRGGDGGRGPVPLALPPIGVAYFATGGLPGALHPAYRQPLRLSSAADRYQARAPPSD